MRFRLIIFFIIISNQLIMTHNASLIQRKILLVRFFKDRQEVQELHTNELYDFDILARNLSDRDQIYLIRRSKLEVGNKVQIDELNDIPLKLLSASKHQYITNRLSNYNCITYVASFFSSEVSNDFQYFYSSFKFDDKQYGEFSLCVLSDDTNGQCIHQGINKFLFFKVENDKLNIFIILSATALALFLSALTSGLTLGIMSLDTHELQVLINAGNREEKNAAKTIYPLRKKGNFLLCTLVIANTVSESMLNYMASFLVEGPLVIVVSTIFLVIFGQIIPLALSTRYGLALGASTIYITYFFIIITFPASYPLGLLLDNFLGEETPTVYDKERLIEYIKLTRPINKLAKDQLDMISGVVYLRDKTVSQAMTKLKNVFMISIDTLLTQDVIKNIFRKGFSRIPVYKDKREKIVSILFLKDLVLLTGPTTVRQLVQKTNHYLAFTEETEKITKIFYYMKQGKTHMIIVKKSTAKTYNVTGIITLEDIIEEILQTEINDEADYQNDYKSGKQKESNER